MSLLLSELASELHAVLKPQGFRKSHHTFSRRREGYEEFYRLLGASHNQSLGPWHFWLEVGVGLPSVGMPQQSPASTAKVHAWGSIQHIVPGAAWRFEVKESSLEQQAREIAALVARASEALPSFLPPVAERAARGFLSVLPVPSTWPR
jgi:hypothetical protein